MQLRDDFLKEYQAYNYTFALKYSTIKIILQLYYIKNKYIIIITFIITILITMQLNNYTIIFKHALNVWINKFSNKTMAFDNFLRDRTIEEGYAADAVHRFQLH